MGPNSKLALIGGIMINCDGDGTDMFLPIDFELRTSKGEVKKNFFEETYGKEAQARFLELSTKK
jgi:hypothetical protein